MPRLFVPLDVNYSEDHRIINCPPLAELLYIRGLCFAKRSRTDGLITTRQLTVIGQRIAHVRRYADLLVDCGLWERNGDGWYITAWLKHNLTIADLHETKSHAGTIGNHIRWHLPPGKPKPRCEHCRDEGLI